MKKALSLILVVALCLGLCACGGGSNIGDSNIGDSNIGDANTNTTASQEEDIVLYNEEGGYAFINQKRLNEIYTTVELTTENWQDYLEVYSWENTIIQKDAFGEITSQETKMVCSIGAKDGKYYHFEKVAIELKDKETGELVTYTATGGERLDVSETFSLDQYECTRIKGTLYLIDIPEEVIMEDSYGNRAVNIGYSDESWGPTFSASIFGRLIRDFDIVL